MDQEEWMIRSNKSSDSFVAFVVALMGAAMAVLARHSVYDRNGRAAYWLGCLLLTAGVGGLIWSEEIELTVDPQRRVLRFRTQNRWTTKEVLIPFSEVDCVNVSRVGKVSNGMERYFLSVWLKNGKRALTGKWSLDQEEMLSLAEQLARAIGCETKSGLRVYSVGAQRLIVAGVIAVGLYAAWFRLRVGPWCPAMWFGSAPPLLIIVFFFTVRSVMRYFPEE
jgi:hypothetical protein